MIPGFIFLALLLVWIGWTYNRLVRARSLVQEAWSGIDVQLKRRHDLLVKLVEAVKGYASYEKSLLTDVSQLRQKLAAGPSSDVALAEGVLTGKIQGLLALAEAYPDLKANQSFLDLQKNISQVEEDLQMARRYYNGTVRDNNVLVQSIPTVWLAGPLGMKNQPFFELQSPTESVPPEIRLS